MRNLKGVTCPNMDTTGERGPSKPPGSALPCDAVPRSQSHGFPHPPQEVHQKAKVAKAAVSHFETPSFRRSERRATRRVGRDRGGAKMLRSGTCKHVHLEFHSNICWTLSGVTSSVLPAGNRLKKAASALILHPSSEPVKALINASHQL